MITIAERVRKNTPVEFTSIRKLIFDEKIYHPLSLHQNDL